MYTQYAIHRYTTYRHIHTHRHSQTYKHTTHRHIHTHKHTNTHAHCRALNSVKNLCHIPYTQTVALIWRFGKSRLYIAKLNVHHLGCRHESLSAQYSKPPIKMFANCIFRAIRQIFDSPIIPCIW